MRGSFEMALKVLMLRQKLDKKQSEKRELESKLDGMKKREKELENDVREAATDEEQEAVEKAIGDYETELAELKEQLNSLSDEIAALEAEINGEEENQESEPDAGAEPVQTERKGAVNMSTMTRTKNFEHMDMTQRGAFFAREDVHGFLERVREVGRDKRSISGASLLIPEVLLPLLKESTEKYSKLYKHVNVQAVPGTARQNVMGTIPEAVWTEMCLGILNELSLSFTAVEVDGYKVGGYIPICTAMLEDADINLADEIISAIGQGIGYALDKAILYGTGTKMPLGIVTRLAQTAEPSDYPSTARAWEDLSTTNIVTTSNTGLELFQDLVIGSGAASTAYAHGEKFWTMNEATYTQLAANAMSINASGAIVTGMTKTMPIIGGTVEILDFIPDGVIIGGYGELYLLAERAGTALAQSEHVRFIEDQVVFRGTARYDGTPVIAEGFVAFGINGASVDAAAVTFAEDTANADSE